MDCVRRLRFLSAVCVVGMFCVIDARADDTFVYAVQISATVQSSPPQINLQWLADPYGAASYTIYRKSKDATSWGTGLGLSGSTTSYSDGNVTAGSTYEYQIVKQGS